MRRGESFGQYQERLQKNAQQIVELSIEQNVTIAEFEMMLDFAKSISLETKLKKD